MKTRSCVVILSAIIVAAVGLSTGPASATSLADILKAAKAREDKFQSSIKDLTIEIEMITRVENQQQVLSMKKMQKGKLFRIETKMAMPSGGGQMPDMTTVVVWNGKEMWTVAPFVGKRRMSEKEVSDYRRESDWTDWLGSAAKLVGEEKVGDRKAWVIEATQPAGHSPFSKIWIDTKSYVLLRGTVKSEEGMVEMRFSDFRKVHGDFEMPYKYETYQDQKLVGEMIVKVIKTNTGLSDALFDPSQLKTQGPNLQDMLRRGAQDDN